MANALVPQSTRRRPSPTTTRTPALRPTHQVTLTSCTGSGHAPPTNRIHNASEEETVAVVHRRAARAIHNQNATTPHPSAIPLLLQPAGTPTSIPSRTRGHSPDRLRRDPIPTLERGHHHASPKEVHTAGTKKAPRPPARPSARIPNPNARTRPQRLPSTRRWTVPPSTPRRTSRTSSCQCWLVHSPDRPRRAPIPTPNARTSDDRTSGSSG